LETAVASVNGEEKDLEDNDNESLEIEESDDSGSEFQASEDEDRDEEIMVDAAVLMSLRTVSANGVGTSSHVTGPSFAAALRAAAAERRIASRYQTLYVGDSMAFENAVLDDSDDDLASATSSNEEPLAKGKLRQTANPTKMITASKKKTMTNALRRKTERTMYLSSRRVNEAEKRDLVRKLGRKLTYVSTRISTLSRYAFKGFLHLQLERRRKHLLRCLGIIRN